MKDDDSRHPFEKFNDALKTVLRASKGVIDEKLKALRAERKAARATSATTASRGPKPLCGIFVWKSRGLPVAIATR